MLMVLHFCEIAKKGNLVCLFSEKKMNTHIMYAHQILNCGVLYYCWNQASGLLDDNQEMCEIDYDALNLKVCLQDDEDVAKGGEEQRPWRRWSQGDRRICLYSSL